MAAARNLHLALFMIMVTYEPLELGV